MSNQGTVYVQTVGNEQAGQTDPVVTVNKKRRPSKGFNAKMGEAELLAKAMTANQEALTPVGGGEELVTLLKTVVEEAKELNKDQERFKALQKDSTTKVRLKVRQLDRLVRKARSIVKNELEQDLWVEFGITATR